MKTRCRLFAHGLCAATALALAGSASAQDDSTVDVTTSPAGEVIAQSSTSGTGGTRSGPLPFMRDSYIGLNLGRSDYDLDCGALGGCDNSENAGRLYIGGMFNRNVGLELGYLHMGEVDRAGGDTRAHGLNLSVVGRVPFGGDAFGLFGKLGTTYGRTETSAAAGSGITTGDDDGFGLSYGAGLSYDFQRSNWAALLEWERHRFKFAGDRREWVEAVSAGVKYRF